MAKEKTKKKRGRPAGSKNKSKIEAAAHTPKPTPPPPPPSNAKLYAMTTLLGKPVLCGVCNLPTKRIYHKDGINQCGNCAGK